jgi:hypothetical protein
LASSGRIEPAAAPASATLGVSNLPGVTKTREATETSLGVTRPSAGVTKTPVKPTSDTVALVRDLNKFLNDSGHPDQFRLDPASDGKLIQQINPASGAVIGEFSAVEFPALARSVGVAGLLVDSVA